MNKQELIGDYKRISNFCETVSVNKVIQELEQLAESQKVTIPQFVADWYEDIVDEFYVVLERLVLNYKNNTDMPICKWFFETEDALTILINMHQFGYTVEKEKQYLVKAKGMDADFVVLKLDKIRDSWYLGNDTEYSYTKVKHTRKELEQAGFGWVFGCPGVEIEEVEG